MTESPFLSLPDELLDSITSFTTVEAVLPLALSCKLLHRHLKDRLHKNQTYHALYRVCHDRRPLTVPLLLRLAISDPDAAWHIRAFESWRLRTEFSHWTTDRIARDGEINDPNRHLPPTERATADENFFTPQDYEDFRAIMETTLRLDPHEMDDWFDAIRQGCDAPLKAMLFAIAPRLDRLNLLTFGRPDPRYSYGPGNRPGYAEHTRYALAHHLDFFIRATPWSPGFCSLRKISICTHRPGHHSYHTRPSAVATLFSLPSLKIINLHGVNRGDNIDFEIPAKSSSVEELSLHCCKLDQPDLDKFLLAPRDLRSFASVHCTSSVCSGSAILKTLLSAQSHSLESLSLDSYGRHPLKDLARFEKLILLNWVPVCALVKPKRRSHLAEEDPTAPELMDILPPSLKSLSITSCCAHVQRDTDHGVAVRKVILPAIVELVEDESFAGLMEVCLYPFGGSDADWDVDAVRRIEAKGIDTHLRCTDGIVMEYENHVYIHNAPNEIETDV